MAKASVIYTIKKFVPILPYTIVVTTLAWVTKGFIGLREGWSSESFVDNFLGDFAFDLLLISGSYTRPLVAPLWYLSAMLIVFPLFALFAQMKNRYLRLILCLFIPIMYYGWVGVSGKRDFPHDMLRVFVGMMLGVVIYEFVNSFSRWMERKKLPVSVIELAALLFPIVGCYNNWDGKGFTSARLYLLCFCISLTICLSGVSYSSNISGKCFNYLGKLSMPLYIVHWYVGTLVKGAGEILHLNNTVMILGYYFASIIAAMLFMFIMEKCKLYKDMTSKISRLSEV
jgi:peptidoglycan/LPS O-acetylase OafA/YrhL